MGPVTLTATAVVIGAAQLAPPPPAVATEWSPVINTALLIILFILQRVWTKKVDERGEHIRDLAKETASDVKHVAEIAASAAQAAEAASRIAKDIGGPIREARKRDASE